MVWGANDKKASSSGGSWCGAGKSTVAGAPVTPKQDKAATPAEHAEAAAKAEKPQ